MNSAQRGAFHIISLVTNNAVGDSRVLKCAQTLAESGYRVTLLCQLLGDVQRSESHTGFTIERVTPNTKASTRRITPLGPLRYLLKVPNSYVRYGARLLAPDFLFWRWSGPILLKISPRFLYACWPLLTDGERTFSAKIDQLAPDVIHANDCDTLGIALRAKARAAKKGKRISVLYDAHEYVQGVHRKHPMWRIAMSLLEAESIHKVDSVMTVSETIAQMLESDYHLTQTPSVVLNAPRRKQPAIDPEMQTIRKKIGLSDEVPLHVYVGAAAPQRGLSTMIDALRTSTKDHIALVVNPANAYVKSEFARAQSLGVADRVHIHAYVPEWYVSTFVSDATSGVIPILHYPNHEISLVTKFFEYLHAGLPIIVSDMKTMAAEVKSRGNGVVFTAENSQELAAAYEEITLNRARYVAAITPQLLDEYAWEHQGDKLLAVHDQLAQISKG
jgi:glycosyltransferase involved in cell wall biosynthesis